MKRYFFGKLGKVFGPYSQFDFEKMKRNGDAFQFTFYCSVEGDTQSEWLMLDPTPPKLDLDSGASEDQEWLLIDRSKAFRLEPELVSSVGGSFLIHAQSEKLHAPLRLGQQIRVSTLDHTRDAKIVGLVKVGKHWRCDVSWVMN